MTCICAQVICEGGKRWTCLGGCKRFVPWCNGGHSGDYVLDRLCDECADKTTARREKIIQAYCGGRQPLTHSG